MDISADDLIAILRGYDVLLAQVFAWRMIANEYQTWELYDKYTAYLKSVGVFPCLYCSSKAGDSIRLRRS